MEPEAMVSGGELFATPGTLPRNGAHDHDSNGRFHASAAATTAAAEAGTDADAAAASGPIVLSIASYLSLSDAESLCGSIYLLGSSDEFAVLAELSFSPTQQQQQHPEGRKETPLPSSLSSLSGRRHRGPRQQRNGASSFSHTVTSCGSINEEDIVEGKTRRDAFGGGIDGSDDSDDDGSAFLVTPADAAAGGGDLYLSKRLGSMSCAGEGGDNSADNRKNEADEKRIDSELSSPPTPGLVALSLETAGWEDDDNDNDEGNVSAQDKMGADIFEEKEACSSDGEVMDEQTKRCLVDHRRRLVQQRLIAAVLSHPRSVRSYCLDAHHAASDMQQRRDGRRGEILAAQQEQRRRQRRSSDRWIERLRSEPEGTSNELDEPKHIVLCDTEETQAEREALNSRIGELMNVIEERTDELKSLRERAERTAEETEETRRELEEKKGRISGLRDGMSNAIEERDGLRQEIERLTLVFREESRKAHASMLSELAFAKSELEEQTKSANGLEDNIQTLKKELNAKEETILTLQNDLEAERAMAASCEEERIRTSANVAMEVEAEMARKESVIETLKGEMGKLMEKFRDLEGASARRQGEYDNKEKQLRSQLDAMEEAVRAAEESKLQSNAAFKELDNQHQLLEIGMNSVQQELVRAIASRKEAESRTSELNCAVQQGKETIEGLRTQMTKEMEFARDENKTLLKKLEESEAMNAELAKAGDEARRERDAFAKEVGAWNAREAELLGSIAALHERRRLLHNRVMQLSGNIRVFVRVRPTIHGELLSQATSSSSSSLFSSSSKGVPSERSGRLQQRSEAGSCPFKFPGICDRDASSAASSTVSSISSTASSTCVDDPSKHIIIATEPYKDRGGLSNRQKRWKFGFDNVFTPSHDQEDVWEATSPLVQSTVDGFNVCIFAYGQTGAGKTYTMLGDASNPGIVTRAVSMLFANKADIEANEGSQTTVSIAVELLEIYNEKVRDLLAPNEDKSREYGREINLHMTSTEAFGNVVVTAKCEADISRVLDLAQKRRCVKATDSNVKSSRSHLILTVHFKTVDQKSGFRRSGKLHICDLAGSERLSNSGAEGTLLKETRCINSSLATLSNVIEKLQSGDRHIPYRESKLTYLLKNSLGGDSKSLAIVCCNPLPAHFGESMCSLRFAAKANRIELKAKGNFSC